MRHFFLLFLAPTLVLAANPLELSLSGKSAKQGATLLVKVHPKQGDIPSPVTVRFGEQTVVLWDCGSDKKPVRCGMIAVPVDAKLGKNEVVATWGSEEARAAFTVKKGTFRVNKLTVDPRITKPSEEEQKQIATDKEDITAAYALPSLAPQWEGPFELPTKGGVTSNFGNQRTYNGEVQSIHFGVDIRANEKTSIFAANAGKVLLARLFFLAGNMVLIDHGSGMYSSYGHMSSIAVTPGQMVKKGELLGKAGSTGRATGPHLHWGTRVNGISVDPMSFMSTVNKVLSAKSVSLK